MNDQRTDLRGTRSYAENALAGQSSYWIQQVNIARRKKGLSAVGISGKPWEQLSESEKRNVQAAQLQDRLQDARDEAKLIELRAELARLKKLVRES